MHDTITKTTEATMLRTIRLLPFLLLLLSPALWPATSSAQEEPAAEAGDAPADDMAEAPAEEPAGMSADLSFHSDDLGSGGDEADGGSAGGFVVGGKLGGGLAFSDLSAHPTFALELGYRFDAMDGAFGAVLDVVYSVPTAEGSQDDPRVPGGSYDWELWQKQLVLQPTFVYRLTMLKDLPIMPYVGIGPRIYMLQTVERGSADGVKFPRSTENSTKVGFGLPLGVEYGLGPGFLFGEVLIQWGPIDHEITGDSNLGTATLWLGYRAVL